MGVVIPGQDLLTFEAALFRCKNLLENSTKRVIIGIVGKPGAGKSTLSQYLMANLPQESVSLLPMDGYHLSNSQLESLGRSDRKGAPDTFDSFGFAALLERISTAIDENIYFPIFHREIEESIAGEGVITSSTHLVITEGNYLLHDEGGWETVAPHLTQSWYVQVDDEVRLERLTARHHLFGKDEVAAFEWAHGSDERNAQLVERSKKRANFLVINSNQ
jgi:pantothenate kinase